MRARGRHIPRSERGQAMPLAAIGIFIMCLGVISTMNIGRAVHKRIKMQNTADSAAYSLAAAEARTFNYIAFLNRAQIAHYNTAMMVQSYTNYVGYLVGLMGAAMDTLGALDSAIITGCTKCVPPSPYCVFCGMKATSSAWMASVKAERQKMLKSYEKVDSLGHEIAQAMAIFNKDVVFKAQLARAALMNVQLLLGARAYIERMDTDMTLFADKSAFLNTVVNAAMNSIEYYQSFDRSAGLNPMVPFVVTDYMALKKGDGWLPQPKSGGGVNVGGSLLDQVSSEPAYQVMGELVNATRTPQFVFDRSISTVGPSVLAASFGASPMAYVYAQKRGQTRLVKAPATPSGVKINAIANDPNHSVGSALASEDYTLGLTSGASMGPANVFIAGSASGVGSAISAYDKRLVHKLYKGSGKSGAPYVAFVPAKTAVAFSYPGPLAPSQTRTASAGGDHGKFKWPGLAPFFKFNAKGDRLSDYNQPSTWIFLNKQTEDVGTGSGLEQISWQHGSQQADLDMRFGTSRNSFLFEGMTVLSRGMVYYHRPGVWAEQPNFFNPFWRARLAPVGQKLQNFWERYVSSKISTDSKDKRIQQLTKLLKNAQMDAFTAAITALIAH